MSLNGSHFEKKRVLQVKTFFCHCFVADFGLLPPSIEKLPQHSVIIVKYPSKGPHTCFFPWH